MIFGYIMPIAPVMAAGTATYTRDGGERIDSIATMINDDLYLDVDYNAYNVKVNTSDIEIYDYESTTRKQSTGNGTPILYSENTNKYYLKANTTQRIMFYSFKLGTGSQKYENIATVIYKNAIVYNGRKYNVKMNIKEINKIGNSEVEIGILAGQKSNDVSDSEKYDMSIYDSKVDICIEASSQPQTKTEVKVEYFILDEEGNEQSISGLFMFGDIDNSQGAYFDDFLASTDNVYMYDKFDTIKYKTIDDKGTYIYSSVDEGNNDHDVYLLIDNKNKIGITLTWDELGARSSLGLVENIIKIYHKITTKVTGGTITSDITQIKDGENKTITYQPENDDKYLKSIKVDGQEVSIDTYKDKYDFTNITLHRLQDTKYLK